jgi:HD-like signal output (HDOD) protein
MKITCGACDKSFVIPDEKLPTGKRFAFPCPACKQRIEVDTLNPSADVHTPTTPSTKSSGTDTAKAGPPVAGDELKKRVLHNLDELPPMPQVVFKAYEIMDDPNASTKQLADLIETDQAIATKVLKMANSAYYGMSGKVSSVQHASVVLGYKALGELIALAGTSTLLGQTLYGYELDSAGLWRHAMTVAFGSKILAKKKYPDRENDAFSAGLIHDVGKLILDRHVLNRKKLFDEYMGPGDKTFLSAEKKILGFDHAEIGFEICKHWHIPETLSHAIRFHHYPNKSSEDALTYVVSMANTIASIAESEDMVGKIESGIEAMMFLIDDDVLKFLDIEETEVLSVLQDTVGAVDKISQTMEPAN